MIVLSSNLANKTKSSLTRKKESERERVVIEEHEQRKLFFLQHSSDVVVLFLPNDMCNHPEDRLKVGGTMELKRKA